MRLHTYFATLAAGSLALVLAAPAGAQSSRDRAGADYATDAEGRVYGDAMPGMPSMPAEGAGYGRAMPHAEMDAQRAAWEEDRADWLDECRARMDDGRYRGHGRDRDHGLGGALIGAATGGLAGNLIGGRGNRTEGTVLGALAGAAVGTVIDRSDNAGNDGYTGTVERRPTSVSTGTVERRGRGYGRRGDYCEQYFDYYTSSQTMGYQGYPMQMVMVPVAMQQNQTPCTETVTTTEYVTVQNRGYRHYHRRSVPQRVRVVHDKRIPM